MGISALKKWHGKAKSQKDSWIIFILYWIIFESYITILFESSKEKSLKKKINEFFNEVNNDELKNIFNESLKNPDSIKNLEEFSRLSPIEDLSSNSSRKEGPKKITKDDFNNLQKIFSFIYRIRCNTFHGSKKPEGDNYGLKDPALVKNAGEFLKRSIDLWLANKS